MNCQTCGTPIAAGTTQCPTCGARIAQPVTGATARLEPTTDQAAQIQPGDLSPAYGYPPEVDPRAGFTRCPHCGSEEVVPNLPIIDKNDSLDRELSVDVVERPNALIFKGEHIKAALRAWVCGSCGYTALFVTQPQALYALYQRTQG